MYILTGKLSIIFGTICITSNCKLLSKVYCPFFYIFIFLFTLIFLIYILRWLWIVSMYSSFRVYLAYSMIAKSFRYPTVLYPTCLFSVFISMGASFIKIFNIWEDLKHASVILLSDCHFLLHNQSFPQRAPRHVIPEDLFWI